MSTKVNVTGLDIVKFIEKYEKVYLVPLERRLTDADKYYKSTETEPTDKEKKTLEKIASQIKDLKEFIHETQKIILSHAMMVAVIDTIVEDVESIKMKTPKIEEVLSKLKLVNGIYAPKDKIDKFGDLMSAFDLRVNSIEINK